MRDGVLVAIGHTAATPQQIRDAISAGATLSTHLGNGCAQMLPRHPNFIWEQLAADDFSGFTTHTDVSPSPPWWAVDFGTPRLFGQIHVWNRTDCCANRLRDWSVLTSNDYVNWTEIYRDSRPQGAGQLTVINGYSDLYNGSNAGRTSSATAWVSRFVRIRINRTEYLHLGEVQIYGD